MLTRRYHFPANELREWQNRDNPFIFLDIETTGLQRDTTILYLIGCGYFEENEYHIIQWFNDDAISEPDILLAFQEFIIKHPGTLFTFNGEGFDIPYLNRHYELNEIPFQLDITNASKSLDIYKQFKPFQLLFGMPHGRQKDWEHFLNIDREDRYNGGQLIGIYKEYLRKKDDTLLEILLLHNMEDIRGMEHFLPLLSYPAMLEGHITLQAMEDIKENSHMIFTCSLKHKLPYPLYISNSCQIGENAIILQANMEHKSDTTLHTNTEHKAFATSKTILPTIKNESTSTEESPIKRSAELLSAKDNMLYLNIPLVEGTLKYFYPDYRNYYYLPEEDRAVHKSVGCYVDKKHRKAATAATCYVRKTGLFLPVPLPKKYKGIDIHNEKYRDILTFYKTDYKNKATYIDTEELFHKHPDLITAYLSDWIKNIVMKAIKDSLTVCDQSIHGSNE